MNAWRERNLLEGIRNSLILFADLLFQQLENVQLMEDELRDTRRNSERLAQEKNQVAPALEFEKLKVVSLTQSALEKKQLALQGSKVRLVTAIATL